MARRWTRRKATVPGVVCAVQFKAHNRSRRCGNCAANSNPYDIILALTFKLNRQYSAIFTYLHAA